MEIRANVVQDPGMNLNWEGSTADNNTGFRSSSMTKVSATCVKIRTRSYEMTIMKLKDITSKALGLPDENRMYISESLSPANRVLFNEAYKLKKDLDYKFLWASNGRVFLRAIPRHPQSSPFTAWIL